MKTVPRGRYGGCPRFCSPYHSDRLPGWRYLDHIQGDKQHIRLAKGSVESTMASGGNRSLPGLT